jgi:hypothetical protein
MIFPYLHKICYAAMSKTKKTRRRWDLDLFIAESTKLHGGKYTYDSVIWNGRQTPVFIMCSQHGNYSQTPKNHLRGKGCTNIECKTRKTANYLFEKLWSIKSRSSRNR